MTTALRLSEPAHGADARVRSELLSAVVEDLLRSALDTTPLLLVQVSSPLLVDGPLVVERGTSGVQTTRPTSFTVVQEPIPATPHVPAGHVLVAAGAEHAQSQARLLALLLSAIMDAEMRRHVAENALRGALEIANRDPATGLGNRRAWLQSLRREASRAQRTGRPLAVLVLDLDGLKAVNDAYGHAAGDELIVRTAGALASARRATDQVCRLGGDEFGMVAPDTDEEQAEALAMRVRGMLRELGVRVSLGWTVGKVGSNVDELWQEADAAMYEDKRARRT